MAADYRKRDPSDSKPLLNGRDIGQTRLRFTAEQVVCTQGDPPDALFYIESGQLKVSVVSPSGKEAVIGVRGEGDFFGVRSLVSGDQRLATATALTDCTIVRIAKSAVTGLLRAGPDFAEMFIGYLLRQHLRDQENLIDQLTNSAERRLARVLLHLADVNRTGKPHTIQINQTVLANMIGTTRPRVSAFMNKFRRRGFIEYDRHGSISVRNELLKGVLDA
jgi:CRP/FNR family transcriptional regulator, cyclic AMP receptor protein